MLSFQENTNKPNLHLHCFNPSQSSQEETPYKILTDPNENLIQEYHNLSNKIQNPLKENFTHHLTFTEDYKSFNSINQVKSFLYLKKMANKPHDRSRLLEKRLAERVVMDVQHLIFYKTRPCPQGSSCKHYPRKIVHNNDFMDIELDCYFYHHEKDQRRFVLNENGEREFYYSGNFGNKSGNKKTRNSLNFFESLFHPLYYKNFKCVRTKCENSVFCPYFHSKEEKVVWDVLFKEHFGKDRSVFTKRRNEQEDVRIFKKSIKWQGNNMLGHLTRTFIL